jgi:hypothetical protein
MVWRAGQTLCLPAGRNVRLSPRTTGRSGRFRDCLSESGQDPNRGLTMALKIEPKVYVRLTRTS